MSSPPPPRAAPPPPQAAPPPPRAVPPPPQAVPPRAATPTRAATGDGNRPTTLAETLALTHEWFHHHSGWAPPDEGTLAEWMDDGVCRCPDDCLVAPEESCSHGLASWFLVLEAQAEEDRLRRQQGGATG